MIKQRCEKRWLIQVMLAFFSLYPFTSLYANNLGRSKVSDSTVNVRIISTTFNEQELRIDYEVSNHLPVRVWLFDLLASYAPNGQPTINDKNAYVFINGTSIVVSRRLVEVPDNIEVEEPIVPGVSLLEAGQTANRHIVLPLPLRADAPYAAKNSSITVTLSAIQEFQLQLGYMVDDQGMQLHNGRDINGRKYSYPSYSDGISGQKLIDVRVTIEELLAK